MDNYNLQLSICCTIILLALSTQRYSVDCQAVVSNSGLSRLSEQQPANSTEFTESEEFESQLDPFDNFLNNIIAPLLGVPSRDLHGTDPQFRAEALGDDSNDDAVFMSAQQLIKRSGFLYEIHEVTSDDGYITLLTRIINPRADPKKLRKPPVMLMHGGLIDPTAYLIASSIQHFPEPWPMNEEFRTQRERSSNRSLAFMLCNRGFDVWLVETRGANEYNRRHVKTKALVSALEGKDVGKNMSQTEINHGIYQQFDYWSFTEDNVIQHEIKAQMDKIMEVTESQTISLFAFSLSTRTSLGFLATRPDYARKVRGYVCMAPMISGEGMAGGGKMIIQNICTAAPKFLGQFVLSDVLLTPQVRSLIVDINKNKRARYTVTKFLLSMLLGSSAKYRTNLELNVLSHLFLHLSYKMVKQMCQSTYSDRFQKYDYGLIGNKLIYKSDKPPLYNLTNLQIEDWITVSGSNDNFATPQSYEHLMNLVKPKPVNHYIAPGFNHLDLFAGFENDIYVNHPIAEYLIRKSITPSFDNDNNLKTHDEPVNNTNVNTQSKDNNHKTTVVGAADSKDFGDSAETISSFRTFKLPFLDFKPENIIEASSSAKKSTEDQKEDKSHSNPTVSSRNNFFKFDLSSFKLPSFLGGGGGGGSGSSSTGGGLLTGIFGTGSSQPPASLFDSFTKPFNTVKSTSEAISDVATKTVAKSPIQIPVITDAAKLADIGKQQFKIIDEVKLNINKLFLDLANIFIPIRTKSSARESPTSAQSIST